ncbi:hypothetical protein GINT2_001078 [Glugoides intestinalis]
MLKEQLQELKKSKKTLLYAKNALIRFVLNDEVDLNTLFYNLPFSTQFTTKKSLSFDRHTFSEREEKKFNKKFAPFLKSLISKIDDDNIDIMLEYLLRVYSIDTFNKKELTFILLPRERYFNQLKTIAVNTENEFHKMNKYSAKAIAHIMIENRNMFLMFVEYFDHYDILKDFLDRTLEYIIEMLPSTSYDYLSELYQIFSILIKKNHQDKAKMVYKRLQSYLNAPEFIELFKTVEIKG